MRKFNAIIAGTFVLMTLSAPVYAAQSIDDGGRQIENRLKEEQPIEIKNIKPQDTEKNDVRFKLQSIELSIDEALKIDKIELDKIAKDYLNREITINDLNQAVQAMTRYVRSNGYLSATAYMPAQKITDGALKINIMAGRYGEIKVDNTSRLDTKIIDMLASALKPGDVVTDKKLETILYNISDATGVKTAGIFSMGQEVGTSDITLRIADGKKANTILYTDNYGSVSSGRYRYGIVSNIYNVDTRGSHLSISGLTSNQKMHNYGVSFESVFGHSATTAGISYNRSNYQLGGKFSALGAEGDADIFSVYGKTPLWHTTDSEFNINYGWDYKHLSDGYKNFIGFDSKRHSNALHLGMAGYERARNNSIQYDFTIYTGKLGLDSDYLRFMNQFAKTEGNYTKGVLNLSSLHTINKYWDVLWKLQGQKASRNLDSSEQMYLGGAYGVRAYPRGEGSGDEGYLSTTEYRYHTKLPGLTLSAYYDAGYIRRAKDGDSGSETLKGWGLGISYNKPDNYFLRFDYAMRIGLLDNASKEDEARSRMWFILGKIL